MMLPGECGALSHRALPRCFWGLASLVAQRLTPHVKPALDIEFKIGPGAVQDKETITAYGPGPTKLLAMTKSLGPMKAVQNGEPLLSITHPSCSSPCVGSESIKRYSDLGLQPKASP